MTDLPLNAIAYAAAGLAIHALAPKLGKHAPSAELLGRALVWLGLAALVIATTGASP